MKKTVIWGAVTILVAVVGVRIYKQVQFSRSHRPPEAKTAVSVAVLAREAVTPLVVASGNVTAARTAEVFPDVPGKLVSWKKNVGNKVERDDTLALVDQDRVGYKFKQAPVRAPINGMFVARFVETGAKVGPENPVGLVVDTSGMKVDLDVPGSDVSLLKPRLKARIKLVKQGLEVAGTVNAVSRYIDPRSLTSSVEVVFDEVTRDILPGALAEVEISGEEREILALPRSALLMDDREKFVFVLASEQVSRRKVETGRLYGERYEVLSGVSVGEQVVVQGNRFLVDGAEVKIADGE